MKWVYDLCGAEPIIRDVPVYDATTIADGELLQLNPNAPAGFYTAATSGVPGYTTGCPSTVGATQGLNALGISLETKTTADTPAISGAHNSTAGCYVKAIINPFAVYRAWVKSVSAGTTAENQLTIAASATATSKTQFVLAALGTTGYFNGQWVYFGGSAGPNYGNLRKIASSASSDTLTVDSALTAAPTSADRISFISNPGSRPNCLSGDGLNVSQCSTDPETSVNFRVAANLVDRGRGVEIVNDKLAAGAVDIGSAGAKTAKFYQDLVMKDHVFCNSTT